MAIDYTRRRDRGNSAPRGDPPPNPRDDMSDVRRTIAEALDLSGMPHEWIEGGDGHALLHEGILLMVAARGGPDGVPVAVLIQAVVLENVACTGEMAVDLLARNGRMLFVAWSAHPQPDSTVKVVLGHDMSVERLDAAAVDRMIRWVLDTASSEVDALQTSYGGKRPGAVAEKPPGMPEGVITVTGRYPELGPAAAMAAFLGVPTGRPARSQYEARRDYWTFLDDDYAVVVGCFAAPDGATTIAVTVLAGPPNGDVAAAALMREREALQRTAHATDLLPGDGVAKAVADGALRQLRPREVGAIPDTVATPEARRRGLFRR